MANKEFQVRHGLVVNGSINVTNQVNIAGVSVTEQFQTINTYMTSAAAAGNSYAENVGVSANSYASEIVSNTSFVLSTNMANNALAANNYAGAMANSANVFTSSVYDVTNVAFGHSNTTYAAVNSAFAVINAAFASANNVAPQVKPAFDTANAGYNQANTATGIANYGAELANANYIRLSAAYDVTNSAYTLANADSVRLSAGYTVANAAFDLANTKFSSSGGTVSGSVSIVGDLIISGNTIQVGAETLRVSDPLIYLAGNNYSSDIVDIGFIANYVNTGGANVHTGLYREHENKEYYLFQGYAAEPINNHIGAMSNNMILSVLNADIRTSNLNLGGANAITWISSGYGVANAAFAKANSVAISANTYTAATYAPLTGTGASGTWGISITGSAGSISGLNNPPTNTGGTWPHLVKVNGDGAVEIGRYLDFHNGSADGIDYAVRLQTDGTTTGLSLNGNQLLTAANYSSYSNFSTNSVYGGKFIGGGNANPATYSNYALQSSGAYGGGLSFADGSGYVGLYTTGNGATLNFGFGGASSIASKITMTSGGNITATGNISTSQQYKISAQYGTELGSSEVGFMWHTSGPVLTYTGTNNYIIKSNGSDRFVVYSGSYSYAAGSMRSPIFYDSDDTGYYVDGAGTSILTRLKLATVASAWIGGFTGNAGITSSTVGTAASYHAWYSARTPAGGFSFGTLNNDFYFKWATNANIDAGTNTTDNLFTISSGGICSAYGDSRAPIFYDSNNTGYYANPNGTSNFNGASFASQVNISTGTSQPLVLTTSSSGPWALSLVRSDVGSTIQVFNNNGHWYFGQFVLALGSMRSPIFYDSDNTAYYADPSSSSAFNSSILIGPNSNSQYTRIGGNGGAVDHATLSASNGNLHIDSKNTFGLYLNYYSSGVIYVGAGGAYTHLYNSARSPLFYDSDNTNYYWQPDFSSAHRFQTPSGYVTIGPQNTSWCHFGTDRSQFYFGSQIAVDGNIFSYGSNTWARFTLYYDAQDTGCYVDPNGGTSASFDGNVVFRNKRKGLIGVYDPANTQAIWSMGAAYLLTDGGTSTQYGSLYGLAWSFNPDYSAAGNNPQSKSGLAHQMLLMFNGITKTAIGDGIWTNGAIYAAGNITAYSDRTLKTNVKTIENASDMIKKMRGVYFDWIKSGEHSIGMIAQEVEEVVPELISETDQCDEEDNGKIRKIKTLDYSKLVAVLIEGFKEQQEKIDKLESLVQQLLNK